MHAPLNSYVYVNMQNQYKLLYNRSFNNNRFAIHLCPMNEHFITTAYAEKQIPWLLLWPSGLVWRFYNVFYRASTLF